MLTITKAEIQDAPALTEIQKRAFDQDASLYLGLEVGGPPGYDSNEWQLEMMKCAEYYKINVEYRIIGGLIIFPMEDGIWVLGRVYIDPEVQNQGYGKQVMNYLFSFSGAKQWKLDTPSWALRNHYFYEKLGFVKTSESTPEPDGFRMYFYEKNLA
jgi:GNAT superfamily N-acetyltransferase